MNILSRICDIRPRVKYMMSRIRDNRPMSVNFTCELDESCLDILPHFNQQCYAE